MNDSNDATTEQFYNGLKTKLELYTETPTSSWEILMLRLVVTTTVAFLPYKKIYSGHSSIDSIAEDLADYHIHTSRHEKTSSVVNTSIQVGHKVGDPKSSRLRQDPVVPDSETLKSPLPIWAA